MAADDYAVCKLPAPSTWSKPMSFLCLVVMSTFIQSCVAPVAEDTNETVRYLRRTASGLVTETEVRIESGPCGMTITSVTGRADASLTIRSAFDRDGKLNEARVTTQRGSDRQEASAAADGGKIRVKRQDGTTQEFDCPTGVIVTSAPDWTDSVLAVRRYDRQKAGKQEFAGLWIHPVQPAQRLTFALTRQGEDVVRHAGHDVRVTRLLLVLRGGSRYVVWSDDQGRMVRLVPEKATDQGIVLAGWEDAVAEFVIP
jgi:hypothetical protein